MGTNVTTVVRVGTTIRRPPKPSSPSVQALLRHLHQTGFDGCPHPMGVDHQGRDVLSFVEGHGGSIPLREETVTDGALAEQAQLIRRFHDASASWAHHHLTWDPLLSDPARSSEVVCHNDVSIPNTVYRAGRPVALVDWDFAAPGRRLWDLAYAVWWLVPLHRPEFMTAIGWPPVDRARRLRLFVDAYGLDAGRSQLLDVVGERQRRNQGQLRSWVAAGLIPAYDENDPAVECGRTEYVGSIRPELEAALGAR